MNNQTETMYITPVFNMPWLMNLQVYTQDPLTALFRGVGIGGNVHWRDQANPQGHGPFQTVFQAMEHYNWMRSALHGELDKTEQPINPVIVVDFNTKKRIYMENNK